MNRSNRDPWYESDNPSRVVRGGAWRMVMLIGCIVIGVALCSWAAWGIKVATSGVKGAGDTVVANNAAPNRIRAQEQFYTMFNGIKAADKNLDILAATAAAHPSDRIARMTYDGAVLGCNQVVAAYNAETHKITSRDWLDPELPYEIDPTNPLTDCKETDKK